MYPISLSDKCTVSFLILYTRPNEIYSIFNFSDLIQINANDSIIITIEFHSSFSSLFQFTWAMAISDLENSAEC